MIDSQGVIRNKANEPLSKSEIDEILNLQTLEEKRALFKKLDAITQQLGFENLNVQSRYMFIKLLTFCGTGLIEESLSLCEITKHNLWDLFKNNNNITFADVSKEIIATMIEENRYKKFRSGFLKGSPRILLIGPYEKLELKPGRFLAPPLGIYRIASFLESFGIQTDIYDPNLEGAKWLLDIVKEINYDFICISIYQPTIKNDIELTSILYRLSRNSLFIAGGQSETFNYIELLTKTPLKIIVRGWGEFSLLNMAISYDMSKSLKKQFENITGLYIKEETGKIIETDHVNPYTSKDFRALSLTFNPKIVPYEKYWNFMRSCYSYKTLSIMKTPKTFYTARLITESHCPMRCTFCSSTHFLDDAIGGSQKVLLLPPKDLISMIRNIAGTHPGVNFFFFNDDDFMISKKRIQELCTLIKDEFTGRNFRFIAMGRLDNVDKELLKDMKEVGFELLSYGIESFSDKILKDMNKKLTKERAIRGIKLTLNSGITPLMNFILFYPTVTIEDIKITIDTATDLIDNGAGATYWPYVEALRGASIMNRGYEIKYNNFVSDTTDEEVTNPDIILPKDSEIKIIAEKADRLKEGVVKEIRAKYNWENSLPQPVDTLAYFYAIYKTAGVSTERIEEVVDKLMTNHTLR